MTPTTWTAQDKRHYDEVFNSLWSRGMPKRAARVVASRTVNTQRRNEGRAPVRRTKGTGNPNAPLEDRTVEQLQNIAANLEISGWSKLRKTELIAAIRKRRSERVAVS